MKASAFAYARATSVANALELLAKHGERAKILSGGQSLMPAMNLPDLARTHYRYRRVAGLRGVAQGVLVGACRVMSIS
jgi:carbon-monoxide dehydrogenase medium subunit